MDFHSLTRKELQTLCKKNKIPANITNVAMADALAALPQVEGLDEFLNPREADAGAGTPDIHHRTASRTSTRRKAVREEPQSSKVSSHGTRGGNAEGIEQENKDANVVPVTPAVLPGSRRRGPEVSTRRKKEAEVPEDDDKNGVQGKPMDMPKTPAAVPSSRSRTRATGRSVFTKIETPGGTASVQRAYNTRRSVRLLEKNLSKMSLMDTEEIGLAKIDDVSEEMSNVSQQTENSTETEKVYDAGASLQAVSTVVSQKSDELGVSSLENNTKYEFQSHDSGSEVQLISGTENDVGAGLQSDPQESNLKLEGSSETCDDSNEVRECCDESVVDLNKSIAIGGAAYADNKAGSELSKLEDSCDSSEPENKECVGTKQDALSVDVPEDTFMEATEQDIASLTVVVPHDASMEVADEDVAGSFPISSVRDASLSLKEFVECNTDGNQDKSNETEHWNVADGNYIHNFEPLYVVDEKAADEKDLVSPEGVLKLGSSNFCSSGEHQEEELEARSEHLEEHRAEIEKMDNASAVSGAFSAVLAVEKDSSSENSTAIIELCIESYADKSMEVENVTLESSLLEVGVLKAEDQKDNSEKLDRAFDVTGAIAAVLAVEKDASSEISIVVNEVCIESCADKSMEVENVTFESSLLDVGLHKAEDQMDNSEKLEAKAQPEESEEHAAGEETALGAASVFPCVLSCNSNTLVDGDAIKEAIAIPKQESQVSGQTMTVDPIHEQKTNDILIQSIVADQLKGESLCPSQSETKGIVNEIQTVPKRISIEDDMHNVNMMKENLSTDELHKRSMGELKKMLKKLTLDGKSNCKTNNVVKEVEKKRTALQALPENRMTTGEAQNEG